MSSGALLLCSYPGDYVTVRCEACRKRWNVSKRELVKEHGAEAKLPDLKWNITGCDRRTYADFCKAYYPDLGGR